MVGKEDIETIMFIIATCHSSRTMAKQEKKMKEIPPFLSPQQNNNNEAYKLGVKWKKKKQ
jgi:hypothetical protein